MRNELCSPLYEPSLWLMALVGLVLRSQWDVTDAIAKGTLVRVMADWQFDSAPITLLVPSRKNRSSRIQALIGFLEASLMAAAGNETRSSK
ncbi:LysR family regulator [Pseudomonas sp. GM102]|nr:LysR family regulator [Pseudomonas sp. GM102]